MPGLYLVEGFGFLRLAQRSHHTIAGGQDSLGQGLAQARANAGNEPDLGRHKMLREVAREVVDDAPPGSPAHSKFAWNSGFSTGQAPTCRIWPICRYPGLDVRHRTPDFRNS